MSKRQPQLPTPPANPYGAHPGAGWAPPVVPRKGSGSGRVIGMCVGGALVFFYVVLPVGDWLFS